MSELFDDIQDIQKEKVSFYELINFYIKHQKSSRALIALMLNDTFRNFFSKIIEDNKIFNWHKEYVVSCLDYSGNSIFYTITKRE